ncbi:MAG: cytochrome c [Ignavibacteriae bacterium]|nr:cytochrome c [Ignavibacteriota bacterium]
MTKTDRLVKDCFNRHALRSALAMFICIGLITGCNDMYDSSRIKPLEKNSFFTDGSSARIAPEGTVARGRAVNDDLLSTGRVNGRLADTFPFTITDSVMARGRDRFTTFCTPCHGRLGDGGGMIVQRGFPRPNSFHTDSLRERPAGYFFDVMTNGFGRMYSYAPSVPVEDRWAIVAYIRALQLSQRAEASTLSNEDRTKLFRLAQ